MNIRISFAWSALITLASFAACEPPSSGAELEGSQSQGLKNATRLDASLRGSGAFAGYTYMFHGPKYRRMTTSTGAFDDTGSLPLFAFHLPASYRNGVDAALAGVGTYAGWGYFFSGANFASYDWELNTVTSVGTLADWHLPPPFSLGVDAAVNGEGVYAGKAFFFKGNQYVRYDWATNTVDPGYPLPLTAWNLASPFSSGIDTVVVRQPGQLTFIRGDDAVVYTWATNTVGAVQPLHTIWSQLDDALDASPTRRVMLYVTIDPAGDPVWPLADDPGHLHQDHAPSIQGLWQPLWGHPANVYVDQEWGYDVTTDMLADPHVMAVFASGSIAQWYTLSSSPSPPPTSFGYPYMPAWRPWLESYESLLWNSNVPVLAVCGSHQLFSGVRAGWQSVRHLNGASIAAELVDGLYRPGQESETGVKAIELESVEDPLFAGISNPAHFYLYHADEVIDGMFPTDATRIATRDLSHGAVGSLVQALKYDSATQPSRVFYSTQFHPEIPTTNPSNDGARLIQNFADLALEYWRIH